MNVILGLDTKASVLKTDTLVCPGCGKTCNPKLKRNTTYFTFMFIPLVPLYSAMEYFECGNCKNKQGKVLNKELLNIFDNPATGCGLYTIAHMSKRVKSFDFFSIFIKLQTVTYE